MPGKNRPRKPIDPEAALREYFSHELAEATTSLPRLPPLPPLPPLPAVSDQRWVAAKKERPGPGVRSNLASLLLAACVLGGAALAFSCSPRTALARSIGQVAEGRGLENLKQETITVAGLVWQQGQEYFRQKHSGKFTSVGIPTMEKEYP
jgi:hypothetical protein